MICGSDNHKEPDLMADKGDEGEANSVMPLWF